MPDKREGDNSKGKGKPRRAQYGDNVTMPECAGLYLVEYLVELGVTEGDKSLPNREIESWQRQSGIELQPWEVRLVKRLSDVYLSESHAARDPDAPAPWADAPYLRVTPAPASSGGLMSYLAEMK